jgi:NAD(P)-dependent dehydrogenase (short-subunit alcohol dehydrogenase family)
VSALRLPGRVALVTGAARGIGLATAQALHDRGASVVLMDLDPGAASEAADGVGERALGVGGDVTDPGANRAAVAQAVERFGGLDIAVANAGIAPAGATVKAMPLEAFERVLDVNLIGVYRTVSAALPQVAERGGHMTMIGSVYTFLNGALVAPYAMSKAAVEALGRALRVELAPYGASAGVVFYGFIATEMVRQGLDDDPMGAEFVAQLPDRLMRRLTPEQAAVALVDGIERRSPTVFAPRFLRGYSALRGVLNPVLDWHLRRDRTSQELVRRADVEGRTAGRETTRPAGEVSDR